MASLGNLAAPGFRIHFVSTPEAVPLWREVVVGDPEPWRRGRIFLVVYALVSLANHALLLADFVIRGLLDPLVWNAAVIVIFWLQFYFIWIGVSWVRWLQASLGGLVGFALVIWGVRDGVMLWIGIGIFSFCLSAYLGLAPSVYFFAKRQRERRRWSEVVVIGLVFLLMLASLGAGLLGIAGYRTTRTAEAMEFADRAFRHIFTEHDTRFLLEHPTDRLMKEARGVDGLTKFLQVTTMRAGDVRHITPATGSMRCWYRFPFAMGLYGEVIAEGEGDKGPVKLWMRIGEGGEGWQIDAVWWSYTTGHGDHN